MGARVGRREAMWHGFVMVLGLAILVVGAKSPYLVGVGIAWSAFWLGRYGV